LKGKIKTKRVNLVNLGVRLHNFMPVLAWLVKGWHKIRFDQLKGCG
jgi:hypothetical protein